MKDDLLNMYYFNITDIWQRLCMEHSELLEATCSEYSLLLKNDIEKIEEILNEKEKIISTITELEALRSDSINQLKENFPQYNITNVSQLVEFMQAFEKKSDRKHLFNFNQLLIDIIDKIQDQNKQNQLFINKALLELRQIKRDIFGTKGHEAYQKDGKSTFMASIR